MHHAPALTLTLQPDPLWRLGLRAGGGMGVLTVLGWLGWHTAQAGPPGWPMWAAATLSAIPALWLLLPAHPAAQQRGTLIWQPADGLWHLQRTANGKTCAPPRLGQIDCMVAGQDWLLLRHGGPDIPSAWIPVSRRAHAAQWHALRCAVFSPGSIRPTDPMPDE
jgi:hypothetical protein